MTKQPEKPKPCPFCGSKRVMLGNLTSPYDTHETWDMRCTVRHCEVVGPKRKGRQEAIKAWNKAKR